MFELSKQALTSIFRGSVNYLRILANQRGVMIPNGHKYQGLSVYEGIFFCLFAILGLFLSK